MVITTNTTDMTDTTATKKMVDTLITANTTTMAITTARGRQRSQRGRRRSRREGRMQKIRHQNGKDDDLYNHGETQWS